MESNFSFVTTLLVVGTDLLTRAAVQGIAAAFLSTAIGYGLQRLRLSVTFVPNYARWRR